MSQIDRLQKCRQCFGEKSVRACPWRLRSPDCRKRRSIVIGDRLAILRACPTSLSLFWRRVFDRAVASVLLVNSALDMLSRK